MQPTVLTAAVLCLSLGILAPAAADPAAQDENSLPQLPQARIVGTFPEAVASFGAAILDGWLYVYGGHIGRKHEHSKENVTGNFRRSPLSDLQTWEDLPGGTPLQSVALVAYRGALYRIGGMTAHNTPGEPEDMHSTDEFIRFDPRSAAWTPMPSLPAPRSSHDATVLDDRLYVVGGWRLAGASDDAVWHQTAWAFDLRRPDGEWVRLPDPPFQRRALALAGAGGRLYALGGLTPEGEPSSEMYSFDPLTGQWTQHTSLPSYGFGASAVGAGEHLLVSGRDGEIFRFAAEDAWTELGRHVEPRIFHRLVCDATRLFAVGGANREGHRHEIELFPLANEATSASRNSAR